MAEQLCPVCGCTFVNGGYTKEGALYCCEPCATGKACECGCCSVPDPSEKKE